MFIQLIRGNVSDPEGLRRQSERWMSDLRPGATGFLGMTSGVTADGVGVAVVRFASEADARANSDRPEQGAWWEETAACYSGDVSFDEGADTSTQRDGAVAGAGFVQLMVGRTPDRAAMEAFETKVGDLLADIHPAFLGSVTLWGPDGWYAMAAHFTNEAEARAGEAAMGENPELMAELAEMGALSGETTYYDLLEPTVVDG